MVQIDTPRKSTVSVYDQQKKQRPPSTITSVEYQQNEIVELIKDNLPLERIFDNIINLPSTNIDTYDTEVVENRSINCNFTENLEDYGNVGDMEIECSTLTQSVSEVNQSKEENDTENKTKDASLEKCQNDVGDIIIGTNISKQYRDIEIKSNDIQNLFNISSSSDDDLFEVSSSISLEECKV